MNSKVLLRWGAGLCLAGSLGACAQPASGPALPDWLSQRIAAFEQAPQEAEAVEILALPHAGATAYLFVAPCCDQFNVLYDATGRRLCAPSGGITGRGDGRCAAPAAVSAAQTVWRLKAPGASAPATP
ncbi:DUF6970 domain-containing protein [Ideonella oryzae]|uniref:DUF6970 domain-containing protein n=1 Tax=Ideonella oryzae TaxID=2937441 RepID=A0ABT1BH47_9BURK|nr:hypothetical protein [Ideonella oryzae]MCO5975542.1 hypothetical protein [Ideonella oryzae]